MEQNIEIYISLQFVFCWEITEQKHSLQRCRGPRGTLHFYKLQSCLKRTTYESEQHNATSL